MDNNTINFKYLNIKRQFINLTKYESNEISVDLVISNQWNIEKIKKMS